MLVRNIDDIRGSKDEVDAGDWVSRRLVLRRDGMGYSVHETIFRAGQERRMQYRNHLETVYCIEGSGEIEDLATGEKHPVAPGTVYALDKHDEHILRAHTDLRLVCVFTPALVGPEKHDDLHSYPLLDDDGTVIKR
jgi:L-ectoine synthase